MALVDSGVSGTIMNQDFFSKTVYASAKLYGPDFLFIKGASGKILKVLGKLSVEFTIEGELQDFVVHVVDGLHHSFILCVDFLCSRNATLQFSSTNTIHIPTNTGMVNVCALTTSNGFARTMGSVIVPSHSESYVQVKVSRHHNGATVLLEAADNILSHSLAVAKCLVKVKQEKRVIRLMNPTFENIELFPGQIVATVSHIDCTNIFPFGNQTGNRPPPSVNDMSSASQSSHINRRSLNGQGQTTPLEFDLDNSDLSDSQKHALLEFLNQHSRTLLLILVN